MSLDDYVCENQLAFRDVSMEIKTDEEWAEIEKTETKHKTDELCL